MLTREQALTAMEFHAGECTRKIGPRGGRKEHTECWRRIGKTKTWKRRPDMFRVPVKFGLYDHSNITEQEADRVHVAEECPLLDPEYTTKRDEEAASDQSGEFPH